jgi:hypothetical protein
MNHPHFLVFVVFMVMVMVMVVVFVVMVMVMVRRTLIVSFLDQAIRLVGHLAFVLFASR